MKITMVDKRVGKALAAAVYAADRQVAIVDVAFAASDAGFVPCDFDRPNGADALTAIALGIGHRTTLMPVSRTWEAAVEVALRIVSATYQTRRQRAAVQRRHELQYARARRDTVRAL